MNKNLAKCWKPLRARDAEERQIFGLRNQQLRSGFANMQTPKSSETICRALYGDEDIVRSSGRPEEVTGNVSLAA